MLTACPNTDGHYSVHESGHTPGAITKGVTETMRHMLHLAIATLLFAMALASHAATAISGVTLTASPASPQLANKRVTLTATPINGISVRYKFTVTNPSGYTSVLRNYSSTPYCYWTPSAVGTYTLQVLARENGGVQNPAIQATMRYTIAPPLSSVKVLTNPAAPGAVSVPVAVSAQTVGGANLTYQFWVGDPTGTNWTMLRDYSLTNLCTWTPTALGTFPLTIRVREAGSTSLYDLQNHLYYAVSIPALSAVKLATSPVSPQSLNTVITLTATATGGKSVEYRFTAATADGVTTVLRDYAAGNTCTWTPATAGTYTLQVLAREKGTTQNASIQSSSSYIIGQPLTAVNLTTSPESPQAPNTAITLTAAATGGKTVEYRFSAIATGGTETVLRDYATGTACIWTPATAGVYTLRVSAREAGTTTPVVQNTLSYTIGSPLTAIEVVPTPNPGAIGSPVTVLAKATGGYNLVYQFWVGDPTATQWTLLRDYAAGNTYVWTPTAAGTFPITVRVREVGSTNMYDLQNHVFFPVTSQLSAVSLTAAPASPQPVNTAVTLTATSSGGGTVEYLFSVTSPSGAVSTLRGYAVGNTCAWTPTAAGIYTLQVSAREVGTTTPVVQNTLSYTVTTATTTGTPLTALTVLSSKNPGIVGQQLTVTGQATGGYNLVYQFWVGDPTATQWTLLRDYAAGNTCPWTPTAAGTFPLVVRVREATSTALYDIQNQLFLPCVAGLSSVNLTASPASPQQVNTAITLRASATGGTTIEYKFNVTSPAGTTTVLRDYATTDNCAWTPTTSGTYSLQVLAREQGTTQNAAIQSTISFVVSTPSPLLGLSASPPSPQAVNTAVTLTAQATAGSNLEYQFVVVDPSGASSTLRSYSTTATCAWTPTTAGNYTLQVLARAVGSTVTSQYQQSITYTVVQTGASNYYVATNGRDTWSGKLDAPNAAGTDGPFATLEAARNAIRTLKGAGAYPAGGVIVWVRGGTYPRSTSFALTSQDSGSATGPITYRAYPNETPRISGGRVISNFTAVTDTATLNRIDSTARSSVLVANLPAQGVSDFGTIVGRSWGVSKTAALEVFFQDKPMTLARYPNKGSWMSIASTPDGQTGARIGVNDSRLSRWANVPNIWLHGYWTWNWADSDTPVASLDVANRIITTGQPYGVYGYLVGGRFFAQNLLEELDQPGEWFLNRANGNLYFWPPAPLSQGQVVVSVMSTPLVTMDQVNYVTLRGLTIEHNRGTGIVITGGTRNEVADCTVRNMGNYSVNILGGTNQGVRNCVISGNGDGGITLNGGDAASGAAGGLYAVNNDIHSYARWTRCYHPGVKILGSGNLVAHNLIYDAPHNAIHMTGTKHIIEYNEIHRVVLETQDAGAFYTYQGNSVGTHVRYNYFHDLGMGGINTTQYNGTAAVYFDGGASYGTIYGNLFVRCNVAVLYSGGGDYLTMDNNVVTNCRTYLHADNTPVGCVTTHNIFYGGATEFWNGVTTSTMGFSNNLINIDPLFVDAAHDNYQLQSNSPAYGIGFKTIPISEIGRK